MPSAVHVLIFDGFADWEPAFALAELRRTGNLEVVTLGFTEAPVRSMGGLRVVPDRTLSGLSPDAVRLLVLPGGDFWEGPYPRGELEPVLDALHRADVPIAAICGATLALARAGLLNARAHTSNEREYLERLAPEYTGASRYVDALAVREAGVITASGLGPTEFAREIFEQLDIFAPADRPVWYHLFKHGRFPEPAA